MTNLGFNMSTIQHLFVNIKFLDKISQKLISPQKATQGSSGYDLQSNMSCIIPPGEVGKITTGICLEIPLGYEGQVRSRSGLASKRGVCVVNSPGTIDSDYRGEIIVALINHGTAPFVVEPGDRVAQIVFCPVTEVLFYVSNDLADTGRGSGGFGSTGK